MAVVPVTIYECKDGSSLHLVGCDEGLNGFTAGGCLAQSWQKRLSLQREIAGSVSAPLSSCWLLHAPGSLVSHSKLHRLWFAVTVFF